MLQLLVAWLFLNETLHEKSKSSEEMESSTPSQEDSGISDLSSSDPAPESDTEMTDLLRGGESEGIISDQPLLVAESDVDTNGESAQLASVLTDTYHSIVYTDCDIERVNSNTELLLRKRQPLRK